MAQTLSLLRNFSEIQAFVSEQAQGYWFEMPGVLFVSSFLPFIEYLN
jgi:hypothetical protein